MEATLTSKSCLQTIAGASNRKNDPELLMNESKLKINTSILS
ncbi:MAG: hypothetical protein JWQ96_671 [Segetibacter sp.]|nr:hypothetical protein [Segetibacter sp.]